MLWLATSLLACASVVPRSLLVVEVTPLPAASAAAGVVQACDDGTSAGTLVQREDAAYGNRFTLDCAAASVHAVSFVHFGAANAGPYAYRLRLYDAACRPVGATGVLTAGDAAAAPAAVEVDVSELGWCVGAAFALALEPLTCPVPDDCFPALVVDGSSDADSQAHCAVVVTPIGPDPSCLAPRSADGRYFDFRLRVATVCDTPGCTTAIATPTWSRLKRLYTDPSPGR